MRIKTKRIKVIEMSKEEMDKFVACIDAARVGHTSHYAEEQMSDGSFLGVSLVSQAEQAKRAQNEREAGYERERVGRNNSRTFDESNSAITGDNF